MLFCQGCIIHGIRYGGKAPPRAYRNVPDVPLTVTCIDFSPFTEPVFLAGCENGEIRLYHIRSGKFIIFMYSCKGENKGGKKEE